MNSWKFFDQISVITIPAHHDRIKKLTTNFEKVHLYNYTIHNFPSAKKIINDVKNNDNFSLWSALKHSTGDDTSFNIAMNHINLIREAYYNNKQSILIFENDAEFSLPFDFIKLQLTLKWLKNNKWDIFFFGYCPTVPYITKLNDYIVKIHNPMLAHAYALSRTGMKRVLTQFYRLGSNHIDKYFTEIFEEMHGSYPIINYQNIEPAIYKRIKKQFNIPFTFNEINKGMETCGILFSLITRVFVVLLFFIIILSLLKKHYM